MKIILIGCMAVWFVTVTGVTLIEAFLSSWIQGVVFSIATIGIILLLDWGFLLNLKSVWEKNGNSKKKI